MTITGALLGLPQDLARLPRIIGNHGHRLFDVGGAAGTSVLFHGLRLEDGDAGASNNGGAIRTAAGTLVTIDTVRFRLNRASSGGAISNAGIMDIVDSEFERNRAGEGSAIRNSGYLTLRNSSIREIRNDPVQFGAPSAIISLSGSSLLLQNATVTGATTGLDATDTAGISVFNPAVLSIRNSTLFGFTDRALSGQLGANTQLLVANSILYGSGVQDCDLSGVGASTRIGYSIIGSSNPTCSAMIEVGGSSTNPNLGALSTDPSILHYYREPAFGSPAVDNGSPGAPDADPAFDCLATDQRGMMRPLDGDLDGTAVCDIGSIERSTLPMATFVVNVFNQDLPDANPGDGVCDVDLGAPGHQCTLRAAVMEANAKPGPDRIEFVSHPDGGDVVLSIPPQMGNSAAHGSLRITEQVSIDGILVNGRPITTIVQTAADRIFDIDLPIGQVVRIEELRLVGGQTTGEGGAIRMKGGSELILTDLEILGSHSALGGAVASATRTSADRVDVHSNTAGDGGVAFRVEDAYLKIQRSSIWNNHSSSLTDQGRVAVRIASGGKLYMDSTTVSGNSGGVLTLASKTAWVVYSTVVDNGSLGLRAAGAAASLRVDNSIVAGHNQADCSLTGGATTVHGAYSLIEDGGCSRPSNLVGAPGLAPALHRPDGHMPRLRMPLAGSPVIDAIPPGAHECVAIGSATSDAIGRKRPVNGNLATPLGCDMGAVEVTPSDIGPFQVNVFDADQVDMVPGDGACDASPAPGLQCTLRAAIMEANALPGTQLVIIDSAGASLPLTRPRQAGEPSASHGDLLITDSVHILGSPGLPPTSRPQVLASHGDRIFDIDAPGAEVLIHGLRLSGGLTSGQGGAIRVRDAEQVDIERVEISNSTADVGGGAIAALGGQVLLTEVDLFNNATAGDGAAILNASELTMSRSSVHGNLDLSAESARQAIMATGGSVTLIRNSTIADNAGDGVRVVNGALGVYNATIAENERRAINFAHPLPEGILYVANSILYGNGIGACAASGAITVMTTNRYNLADGDGCSLEAGDSNLVNGANPMLGSLRIEADRFTAYYLPGPNSAAIDAGHPVVGGVGCQSTDQFGVARPVDGRGDGVARCDIGAIEVSSPIEQDEIFRSGFED
jgi:hypothetical protein